MAVAQGRPVYGVDVDILLGRNHVIEYQEDWKSRLRRDKDMYFLKIFGPEFRSVFS